MIEILEATTYEKAVQTLVLLYYVLNRNELQLFPLSTDSGIPQNMLGARL
jgi:hypothetical protein